MLRKGLFGKPKSDECKLSRSLKEDEKTSEKAWKITFPAISVRSARAK